MLYTDENRNSYEIVLNADEVKLMKMLIDAHSFANFSDVTDGENVNELHFEMASRICCPIEQAMKNLITVHYGDKTDDVYYDWISCGFSFAVFSVSEYRYVMSA